MVDATGAPVPWAGLAINVIVGSMTAAFTMGAIDRSLSPSAGRGLGARHLSFVVLACPWPMVASVIAIREIWVYCVFAITVHVGMVIRKWSPLRRIVATGAATALLEPSPASCSARRDGGGLAALLPRHRLRHRGQGQEALWPRSSSDSRRWRWSRWWSTTSSRCRFARRGSHWAAFLRRAVEYADFADRAEAPMGDQQGMVLAIARQGLVSRGLVETAWIWRVPAPQAGSDPRQACTPSASRRCRSGPSARSLSSCSGLRSRPPARKEGGWRTTPPRAAPVRGCTSSWLGALTVIVGFTSCETRPPARLVAPGVRPRGKRGPPPVRTPRACPVGGARHER